MYMYMIIHVHLGGVVKGENPGIFPQVAYFGQGSEPILASNVKQVLQNVAFSSS